MAMRKRLIALIATGVSLLFVSSATAAFPNFSDCPRRSVNECIDIQSVSGSLEIKGFTVPLGQSLEIRGGFRTETEPFTFVPPTGTTGFFSRAIRIPGGILGIEFPIPGNAVLAIAQLAGPPSSIQLTVGDPTVLRLPLKVKLENPILGSNCYIGTNSNPARMNLTTGTTSPPPPNRPITGSLGTTRVEGSIFEILGATSVDNAFAVPGASGCGLLGIVDPLVNLRLRLPSAAGNNTSILTNNIALEEP
jgi:hypothetical protein